MTALVKCQHCALKGSGETLPETASGEVLWKDRPKLVFVILCVITFLVGLIGRPVHVLLLEFFFLAAYLALLPPFADLAATAKSHRWITAITLAWVVSTSTSLALSPLGLGTEPLAIVRHVQTLFHVAFFFCVWHFLARYAMPLQWTLLAIPASCLVIALGMAALLIASDLSDPELSQRWFQGPPFHGHIRHTGYQIAAGLGILLGFCLANGRPLVHRTVIFALMITLATFLFWTGGRGALLSVATAFGLLALAALWRRMGIRFLGLAFLLSVVAGMMLSELLAVFDWNGVLHMAARSADAQSVAQLSTGRVGFWLSAWENVKDHLAFGLGAHGYVFMPNRIFGVQPHSAIVQFVVEWGLIGGALISALLIMAFWRGLRIHVLGAAPGALDPTYAAAGALIATLAVHGLFDGTFFHPQPTFYLALCLAIWCGPEGKELTTRNEANQEC